jgi:hypothetical protein
VLYELINANREAIVQRVCEHASVGSAATPIAHAELTKGVAVFVSQLSDLLFMRHADPAMSGFERRSEMSKAAGEHGEVLLRHGFTLAQVVHDYTEIGRSIVEIATEQHVQLTHEDFVTVYLSVDAAVAGAVTEHQNHRDRAERTAQAQRLDALSKELGATIESARTLLHDNSAPRPHLVATLERDLTRVRAALAAALERLGSFPRAPLASVRPERHEPQNEWERGAAGNHTQLHSR